MADRRQDRGFALLLVFAMAAGIAIMLYRQLPRAAFEAQRMREEMLIERGEQYTRAIQLFVAKNRRYPANMDELEKTGNVRFLRRRYKDPMTGEDEWRLIHVDATGRLTDSLVQKTDGEKKDQYQNTFISEGPAIGSMPTGTGAAGGAALAMRRRPSDNMPAGLGEPLPVDQQPGMQGQVQPGMQQMQPGMQPQMQAGQLQPGMQPQMQPGQMQPGMPGQMQPGQMQPGMQPQMQPGQMQPGQMQPGMPGQMQPGQMQPGMQGQIQPVPPGGMIQGQLYPQQPGQQPMQGQIPLQPQPLPGQPGVSQPVYPGQPPYPGQPGMQPGNMQMGGIPGQPQMQGGMAPGQTYPMNPVQQPGRPAPGYIAGGPAMPDNPALRAVMGQIYGPKPQAAPQQTTTTAPTGQQIGGGIAGVASKLEADSIKVYNEREKYNEWEFIYDFSKDKKRGGAIGQPQGPGARPGGNQPPNPTPGGPPQPRPAKP